jgi:uncharacterized protein (TIGR02452 family)
MMNKDDMDHLVSNVQSIVIDPNCGTKISFVRELELDSYIVIDRNISNIPPANELARYYAQAYKISKIPACELVSVQFPTIFHIHLNTFADLVRTVDLPVFKIKAGLATVYPYAEHSFFEDLPTNTNEEKMASAIATQIGENQRLPTSFYVQCNKQAGNAIVLALKSAKKWIMEGHLTIDGRNISKKVKLAYRVLVSPVPQNFDVTRILRHKLFANRVVSHKHINRNFIVELEDPHHYNHCLEMGALSVDGHTMSIKPQVVASELDAINWYETAMLDMKPDIMTIINDHHHPIFRYKWNAENWIEQMKNAQERNQTSGNYDLIRHLLRVTVMLNTIATLRTKKYLVDDEEVILNLEQMRTIGYDHRSKVSCGKKLSETEFKTPYPSTTVEVINEDCLVLYEQLVAKNHRPLLLNMANPINPGGGYRKGDGAQEENIFRRSDYYHSLDMEIADKDRSERLYCTPKDEIIPYKGYSGFYPMEEFGAIYTSGITVFRGTEAKGYAYMKNPLYHVCAIAMPAYRNPRLTGKNMLEDRPAMNTHRKIQNIFAIGYQHKHDCLVLSALGCGAFKNPPKHIALLFKSVIYQYAGYFDKIYFAIIDDHNTGNQINPHGNFVPFKEILDGLVVKPPKTLRVDGASGPHRILNKTSNEQLTFGDAYISYLPPCQHGTKCRDFKNIDHTRQFSHPPRCSLQTATSLCDQTDDEVHVATFIHITRCKYGGECTSEDPTHLSDYDHPDYCEKESHCKDVRSEHLFAYRHLPVCRDGHDCLKYLGRDPDHMKKYRHCRSICPYDNCCNYFHDKIHWKNTIHSFREPCPFTPYNCSIYVDFIQNSNVRGVSLEVQRHCLQFSHVCPFGRQCTTKDGKHYETTIHIARQLCSHGDKCLKLTQENHLESFAHLGIRDIRLFCKFSGFECQHRKEDQHLKKYRHGQNHDYLSVAPSSNLNSHINFVHNQGRLIKNVNDYIEKSNWEKAKISPEILNWIRALQPVHRCGPLIFQSVLVHGHFMSREYMKLLERPSKVAKAVLQHSRIRLIFLKPNNRAVKDDAFKLIHALVKTEFSKTGADGITTLDPDHEEQINLMKMRLRASLGDHDLTVIYDWTKKIAQASIKLINEPMGIGYNVDEIMGTNKHVFSILGPHRGHHYGDIVIMFKQEIMFHPDANFSIQAGTRFHSKNIYSNRPWVEHPGTEGKCVEDFHSSKLHCSVPRYEYAAATEIVASTGVNNKSMNVTLNDIIQRWMKVDSHEVFESHLPQLIPLDYVDRVYMPKNIFESLTPEAQKSAKEAFKDSLIIIPHVVDLSLIKPGGTVSLDPTRKVYLKLILDKIDERIQQRIKTPRISRGIVITVPGSKFEEHGVLPMTISQSYDLYRLDHLQAPNTPDYTYIYWQAMHGDMMLTIANQKIEPEKKQPNLQCLVCYVAEKPSTTKSDYHETYSYLNDGHPFEHNAKVYTKEFRAKSNVFYRGCNTDDFLTFCLKLSHKTDEVTLSHAGPNGIYNQEKIHYHFNKSDLDLSKIDYVHVSGGNQDVPIRNLTINHELVSELHPSFDKDFKIDTSTLLGADRLSLEFTISASYQWDKPNNNNPFSLVSPPWNQQKSPSSRAESPLLKSSKLLPCCDSIYCLNQNSRDHVEQYSHPCRFNELCRSQADEPHLVHELHNVPKCIQDKNCSEKTDPIHRAQYRHTGLSDYLIPCRYQDICYKKSSEQHLMMYSHGEELPTIKSQFLFQIIYSIIHRKASILIYFRK